MMLFMTQPVVQHPASHQKLKYKSCSRDKNVMFHPERQKGMASNIVLDNNGKALFVTPVYFETLCSGANYMDPWAEQTCLLQYSSWTYNGLFMDLGLADGDLSLVDYHKQCQVEVSFARLNSQVFEGWYCVFT